MVAFSLNIPISYHIQRSGCLIAPILIVFQYFVHELLVPYEVGAVFYVCFCVQMEHGHFPVFFTNFVNKTLLLDFYCAVRPTTGALLILRLPLSLACWLDHIGQRPEQWALRCDFSLLTADEL